jgi:hypothetical protein
MQKVNYSITQAIPDFWQSGREVVQMLRNTYLFSTELTTPLSPMRMCCCICC